MHHSTFNPTTHLSHDSAARKLAEILINSDSSLYSQHIAGKQNVAADSLSRDQYIPDKNLTFTLQNVFSSQVPKGFTLETPPKEIISWLYSLRATLSHKQVMPQEQSQENWVLWLLEEIPARLWYPRWIYYKIFKRRKISLFGAFADSIQQNEHCK